MKTLEEFLQLNARLYPDKTAVISTEGEITYSSLYARVADKVREYTQFQGKAVVFRSSQDANFLITYFAVHLAGAVAVPLEKDISDDRLNYIRNQLKDETFSTEEADILFTTGTTGKSKGVVISHETILANGDNLIQSQGFCHELTFIICGPLNHIGCLSKIFPVIMQGATLYILEGMKDINVFFHALEYPCHKIGTFLVPANIRILISLCSRRLIAHADRIDFIETGAAPISHSDMLKLCSILPHSRLYNTYASTETGIISTYNYNDGRCIEGCLGKPMKHSGFQISQDGTIVCYGDTLMSRYVVEEEDTRKILYDNAMHTSDLGSIDEEGMLHFSGREGDVINTGGYKVAPSEVEDAAMSIPCIDECICIAACHPVIGTVTKLLVKMKEGEILNKKETARYLSTKLERYKVPVYYEQVDYIQRTFNGKPDRKHYR